MAKKNNNEEPLEKQLWKAADKLRKNIDAAEIGMNRQGL
jgi:type I restriction enzyme M protein